MRSDIYTNKHGLEYILGETDRVGAFCGLSPSATGKLRLLTEEMLGLTVRLFDGLDYEFYIENDGQSFRLNLSAATLVTSDQRDKLLTLSSSGGNSAAKGLLGKISDTFQNLLIGRGEYSQIIVPHFEDLGATAYFSFALYAGAAPQKSKETQWDGLEKSIIASLAKDVVIGVKNNRVEMVALIEL